MADMPSHTPPRAQARPSPPHQTSTSSRRRSARISGSFDSSPRRNSREYVSSNGSAGENTNPLLRTPRQSGEFIRSGGVGRRSTPVLDSEDEEERREEFSWARDAGAGRRRRQMEEEEREEKEREREWAMEEEKEDEDEEGGDYYAVLNVGRNATTDQIKASYHSLSRRLHPDKQPPHLRDLATSHFNTILVAYETLINPHKRIIYDQFGISGLKDHTWQLGVKSMSPDEFKLWLKSEMEKQKIEDLNDLVSTEGKTTLKFDASGWLYDQIVVQEQDEEGYVVNEKVIELPQGKMTQMTAKQNFTLPLVGLGELFTTPLLPSDRKGSSSTSATPDSPSPDSPSPDQPPTQPPRLSIETKLGGSTAFSKKTGELKAIIANPALSLSLSHTFPHHPPSTPLSISTLLSGNTLDLTTQLLPTPALTTSLTRSFGQNALILRTTTFPSTLLAPVAEFQLQRRLALRHSFIFGLNSGSPLPLTFESLLGILTPPTPGTLRQGLATVGYIYHPHPPLPNNPKPRASHLTTSYTLLASAGAPAGGLLLRALASRTFYIATPLGRDQTDKTRQTRRKPGIKLSAEASMGITGALTYTLSATRRFFARTSLGLSVSVGGATGQEGVTFGVVWSRLGQTFALPVLLTPVPDTRVVSWCIVGPALLYGAFEFVILRPRYRSQERKRLSTVRRKNAAAVLRRKQKAEEQIELMRVTVERRREAELRASGLVILSATYGPVASSSSKKEKRARKGVTNGTSSLLPSVFGREDREASEKIDVTIPVQALVENSQLIIPRGVDKSRLVGFWDRGEEWAGRQVELVVEYLYAGRRHRVVSKGREGLVAPLRSGVLGENE